MIIKIKDKKKLIAIIIKPSKILKKGANFITPINFNQQLGVINYSKNHIISAHGHIPYIRKVKSTSEILIINKGELRVDFYNNKMKYLFSKILKKGDIIYLYESYHGFKILKNCSFTEIKQGPYRKRSDKKVFEKVIEDKIIIK